MAGYQLSYIGAKDVAGIIAEVHRKFGAPAGDRLEDQFFTAFRELAELKTVGHRRPDLTSKVVYFYSVKPYVIIFRRRKQVAIIFHVAHAASDLTKLL